MRVPATTTPNRTIAKAAMIQRMSLRSRGVIFSYLALIPTALYYRDAVTQPRFASGIIGNRLNDPRKRRSLAVDPNAGDGNYDAFPPRLMALANIILVVIAYVK